MSKSSTSHCIATQPKSAVEAWSRIVPLDASKPSKYYEDEWREERASAGLQRARPPKGKFRPDPKTLHPSSIRDQFSVQYYLDNVPTEDEGSRRVCVRTFDPKMDKETQKSWKASCPQKTQDCYTIDPKTGLFQAADKTAKDAYSKERKPYVARGFCLPTIGTTAANVKNRVRFTEELQKAYDEIAMLEKQLAGVSASNECA